MTAKRQTSSLQVLIPWLDVMVFFAWGVLFLRYWSTGELRLLIHPNYFGLVFVTGIIFLSIASLKFWQLFSLKGKRSANNAQHITLFPLGWSTALLLGVVIIAFIIPPKVLTSDTALRRGVTDSLPVTRSQPESFRAGVSPEKRSLIEWVRTLNVYPEPDAYTGQKVNVKGFVVHSPNLPNNYFLVTRFVLTCCAVDAYPVALPVKIEGDKTAFPPDTWIEVKGQMITEVLKGETGTLKQTSAEKRQLVIAANSVEKIPTPRDPYEY